MCCECMKPFIHTVTLTGIDFWTNRVRLALISQKYPFVEWGVLLSKTRMGRENRYPSEEWINELAGSNSDHTYRGSLNLPLAGHLCGAWARDLVNGGKQFATERGYWLGLFNRIQLNVKQQDLDPTKLKEGLDQTSFRGRFIIQINQAGISDWMLDLPNCDFLFDCSGGQGVLPGQWPTAVEHCGYAGGLGPDNLATQLEHIGRATQGRSVWIDAESGVRTGDVFDLDKVIRFLELAKPYVVHGNVNATDGNTAQDDTTCGPVTTP
jgi:hypothetical protein